MPRAFLITHRRYNTAAEYEKRESSPERSVSVAEPVHRRDAGGGGNVPSPPARPASTTDAASPVCPEELYNLTQLADVSLAAAAGHLFHHRRRDAAAVDSHHVVTAKHSFTHHCEEFRRERYLYSHNHNHSNSHSNSHNNSNSEDGSRSDGENEENRFSPLHIAEAAAEEDADEEGGCGHCEHDGELREGATPTTGEVHGCPDCGKRYSTSSNLARHRQTHRSLGDKKARRCPYCDKVYVSMPAYSMHVRTHNQGCKCAHCGKCFSRPWLLQGHIRTHTGEKPFKCSICTKAFADKSNLRAHVQTHSNTKPHICGRCGKAFALKSYLYKHEESSCMRIHGASSPITVPSMSTPLSHGCPIAV